MTEHNKAPGKKPALRKPASRASAKGMPAGDEHSDAPRCDPVSAEERQRMITTAAYFRAERRDFESGCEIEDWLEAEAEIDRQLACG